MKYLSKLIVLIKIVFVWLADKTNRATGLRYLRKITSILDTLVQLTETKKDDEVVDTLKKILEFKLEELPEQLKTILIEEVNAKKSGKFKEVNISYDKKQGVKAGINVKF